MKFLRFRYLLQTITVACLFCLSATTDLNAENNTVAEKQLESQVTAVTLYRNQALVTRTIEVEGEPGASELVIGDLPENIVPSSLFAEGEDGIEVRAVRYRARAVSNSPREEVRILEAEISSIQQQIKVNQKQSALLQQHGKYLDQLEKFTAPTANFDLGRGVLNAETIEQLTNFSFKQRKEILDTEIKLAQESSELQRKFDLAQRKIREVSNGSSRQERQAVLFAQKTGEGKQTIRLNYLTNSCGWSPTYTVRAESGAEQVRIEYNGLIQQMSGEDWINVNLTLSTASPALSAAGPGLAPFRLTLVPRAVPNSPFGNGAGDMMGGGMVMGGAGGLGSAPAQQTQQAQVMVMGSDVNDLLRAQSEAIKGNRIAINNADNLKTSWTINNVVNNFDCRAILGDTSVTTQDVGESAGAAEEPALNYQISSPVSVQSRNSQQMVRVLTADLESNFYHIATPVLTSYVYRETELGNNSESDLLAGPLTVYLDGRFVGRSEIPTVARGQNFVVGLGADSQLRARRELADRSNQINGGNRETKLEYRLIVENYKDEAASIRVVDRMPIAETNSKIRVTLEEGVKDELSQDSLYVRTMLPKGILRWDTEVAGRAVGEKAQEIEYSFTLEHDRQYVVSLPANLQQQEIEYNELENSRRGGKRMRK